MNDDLLRQIELFDRCVQDRDQGVAAEVLHPDYALVLVTPAAAVIPRDRWLQMLPDYLVSLWDVDEQVVDVAGDVAVVLQRVRMEAIVLGEDRSGIFVLTDVWRKTDGGWQIWRRHSTPLSGGAMPGA
jgi:hypothetical protein